MRRLGVRSPVSKYYVGDTRVAMACRSGTRGARGQCEEDLGWREEFTRV